MSVVLDAILLDGAMLLSRSLHGLIRQGLPLPFAISRPGI